MSQPVEERAGVDERQRVVGVPQPEPVIGRSVRTTTTWSVDSSTPVVTDKTSASVTTFGCWPCMTPSAKSDGVTTGRPVSAKGVVVRGARRADGAGFEAAKCTETRPEFARRFARKICPQRDVS